MSNKSAIALLAAALGAVLWAILRETSWAITIDAAIERLAHSWGWERPAMIATASLYVLAGSIVGLAAWIGFGLGVRERNRKSPLEILYDPNNPKHVETRIASNDGVSRTYYHIEIFNRTTDRTVSHLVVTWDRNQLTQYIDGQLHRRHETPIHTSQGIHPQEKQKIYLLGVEDAILSVQNPDVILECTSYFTIRAKGNDAAEITAEFDYSPLRLPKILKVRYSSARTMASHSMAASAARKNVAAKVPQLSLLAIRASVSLKPCFSSRTASSR